MRARSDCHRTRARRRAVKRGRTSSAGTGAIAGAVCLAPDFRRTTAPNCRRIARGKLETRSFRYDIGPRSSSISIGCCRGIVRCRRPNQIGDWRRGAAQVVGLSVQGPKEQERSAVAGIFERADSPCRTQARPRDLQSSLEQSPHRFRRASKARLGELATVGASCLLPSSSRRPLASSHLRKAQLLGAVERFVEMEQRGADAVYCRADGGKPGSHEVEASNRSKRSLCRTGERVD